MLIIIKNELFIIQVTTGSINYAQSRFDYWGKNTTAVSSWQKKLKVKYYILNIKTWKLQLKTNN